MWVTQAGQGPPAGVTRPLCSLPGVLRQERTRVPPLGQEPRGASAAGQEPSRAGPSRGGGAGGAGAAGSPVEGWPGGGQLGTARSPSPHASPGLQPPPVPPAARPGGLRGALGGLTAPRPPGLPQRPAPLAPGMRGAQSVPSAGGRALPSGSGQTGLSVPHPGLPRVNHTKLKKTWLTRHSEQSLPRSKAARRDGGPEPLGEGKRSAKRPHGTAEGPRPANEGAGAAKRGSKGTESGVALGTRGAGWHWGHGWQVRVALGTRGAGRGGTGDTGGRLGWHWGHGDTGSQPEDVFPAEVTRWRRGEGAPQLCDSCQRGFFNSHWSCARCGFQLCPEAPGQAGTGGGGLCMLGKGDRGRPNPAQHPHGPAVFQEPPVPALPPRSSRGPAEPARPVKEGRAGCDPPALRGGQGCRSPSPFWGAGSGGDAEDGVGRPDRAVPRAESPEGGAPSPGQPPVRGGTVQSATLCDLLASTAVRLCLGQDGVRMAFAPVAPALPSDNPLTSILDSIIARVVERKIQERQAGVELSPPGSPEPPGSHCVLAPSGLLWLHDPGRGSGYELFREHWGHGQPVLVSGLQKRLEPRLWAPESFQRSGQEEEEEEEEEEVEAVNLRAPRSRVRMSSRRFWDGFAASTGEGTGNLWGPRCGFGVRLSPRPLCHRATNLRASLPLPEYCGASGRLNLASYLRGQRGRRWLRPRLCVSYGERGTGPLLPAELEELEAPLRERLGAGAVPGALWHIFRAEDAPRIRDFLRKVGRPGFPLEPPGLYLDPPLRRRLRDECGVSGWSLLQLPGDAVLLPAGAPHQVRSLSGTISVEQRFLSPESAVRLRNLGTGTPRRLRAQVRARGGKCGGAGVG
uniref:Lysine-specific demethylase n=1 Tax=Geospiza parvula TaxID=87175 RepID=A0A8C3NHZ5_GEOPR